MIHVDPPSKFNLGDVDVRISDSIPGIPQDSEAPAFYEANYEDQRNDFKEWDKLVEDTARICGSELDLEPICQIIGKPYEGSFYRCMVINVDKSLKDLENEQPKKVPYNTRKKFRENFEEKLDSLARKMEEAIQKKAGDPDALITSRPQKESDIELPNAQMANTLISLYNSVTKKGAKWEGPVEITAKAGTPILLDFSEAPQPNPTGEGNVFFSGFFHKINENNSTAYLIPSKDSTRKKELKFKFDKPMKYDILTAQRDERTVNCKFHAKYDESMVIISAKLAGFKIIDEEHQTSFGDFDY